MISPEKYRKKPVEIEAVHLTNDVSPDEVASWCGGRVAPHPEQNYTGGALVIEIETLEGTMRAEPGDWIIKGVVGKFYPCRDDIFEATYEATEARTVVFCGNSNAEEIGQAVARSVRRARRGGDAA
ncbi:hypothetical protein OG402_41160 [Streptomyces anulatus]|uniref:hypothetical protein n=1 Tax=Streptomyces anulatus TaxID=1892 RepID=UPI00224F66E9|nr:hypothetical protein [Streptomyces anulatus]MCX4606839.1 hypothetical protein [Streptomyces anulatus]